VLTNNLPTLNPPSSTSLLGHRTSDTATTHATTRKRTSPVQRRGEQVMRRSQARMAMGLRVEVEEEEEEEEEEEDVVMMVGGGRERECESFRRWRWERRSRD
jgi:hypothetical protein